MPLISTVTIPKDPLALGPIPGWQGRDASGNPIPKKGGKRTLNKRKNRKTRKAHKRRRYSRRH